MGKRGSKSRGRGGRGGHGNSRFEPDFGDDFIAFGEFVDVNIRGRGRGRGRGVANQMSSVFIPPANRGGNRGARPATPRGRGSFTPRGRGDFAPRGRGEVVYRGRGRSDGGARGRGRGFGYQPGGRDGGMDFGEQQNRLLQPISFVRAQHTAKTLFQDEDEIFKPEVVDTEQGDNIPTADVIDAAFAAQEDEEDDESSTNEDDLQDPTLASTEPTVAPVASSSRQVPKLDIASAVSLATAFKDAALTPREERFVPVSPALSKAIIEENVSTNPPITDSDSDSEDVVLFVPQPRTPLRPLTPLPLLAAPGPLLGPPIREDEEMPLAAHEKDEPKEATKIEEVVVDADIPTINFEDLSSAMFVDTNPTPVIPPSESSGSKPAQEILGTRPTTSSAPGSRGLKFTSTSQSTTTQTIEQVSTTTVQETSTIIEATETVAPVKPPTPNFHSMTFSFKPRTEASRARKAPPGGDRRGLGFKSKGTSRVPREGDSDLDWGDAGPPKLKGNKEATENEREDEESDGDHGMVEDIDSATMLKFLKGVEKQEWKTMDDVGDEEKLRQEDEDDENGSWSDEDDDDSEEQSDEDDEDEGDDMEDDELEEELTRILVAAEAELMDELDEDEDSDDDLDESFRTQLMRMRQNTSRNGKGKGKGKKGKGKGKGKGRMDDDSSDEIQMSGFSWAEKDEEFIASIQEQIEEELFLKRERKRGIISPPLSPASRGKNKHVPPELQAQWERDRSKKAENKRLRALQRQAELAQDGPKRGSGRKASFMFNNSVTVTALPALEPKLRSFVNNVGMHTMALPAMDKESRRRVHLLAECFGIKTASKGQGTGRYVTLIRTSRTGLKIDESKIRRLLRAAEDAEDGGVGAFNRAYSRRDNDGEGGSGGKARIKTRDGEVVGRTAARIGVDNIGHQLLSRMGWTEGERIGMSGGIADPLVAVMKSTKLGLGATRK
ncbi:Serine/threonine-protein kinase [Ceratobasidium sp. AG-Ba]|nr:Serine/threonine-protein kinase [Ceratobasidium sp. AG-Ba]